jgi:hypothetical protein
MFPKATYGENKGSIYHLYNGGPTWVPTVPASVGKPGDILTMKIESLTQSDFIKAIPRIKMAARLPRAWMPSRSELRVSQEGGEVTFDIEQRPSVEGISCYSIKGKLVDDLVFQTGSIFAVVEVVDAFSTSRFLQLHHDGYKRAWVSLGKRGSSKVSLLSFDGLRFRLRYRWAHGTYGTAIYVKTPEQLYSLGRYEDFPASIDVGWAEKKFHLINTQPLRELERMMVRYAGFYETGRIGAEVAYSIMKEKLRVGDLILNEPGRSGADLQTRDSRILAESRFIVEIDPTQLKSQISRDFAQMTRKLRRDFRYNPDAETGYTVVSFPSNGRIDSLVIELAPAR